MTVESVPFDLASVVPDLPGGPKTRRWLVEWRGAEWLTSNDRDSHWGRRKQLSGEIRAAGSSFAKHAKIPQLQRVHYLAIVHNPRDHPKKKGPRDVANAAPTVKALVDGVTDAGVTPGDSNRYVVGPDLRPGESISGVCLLVRLIVTDLGGQQ